MKFKKMVVMVGMMGVGKMVVGCVVVVKFGVFFFDFDVEIEVVVNMIIVEIFVCDGEFFFCKKEV